MDQPRKIQSEDAGTPESKWNDLYRIGFVACVAFPALTAAAVIAYFLFPYTPGVVSVKEIFEILQANRLGGLFSLDLLVPILLPAMILEYLALYAALKRVNESWALIALVAGLTGIVLWFVARPIAEMASLSDRYAAASSEEMRRQYLSAGEALHALFNATNWIASQFLFSFSGLISSLMMLRSGFFGKATAWTGIVLSIAGMGFFLPTVGLVLLLGGTIAGIA